MGGPTITKSNPALLSSYIFSKDTSGTGTSYSSKSQIEDIANLGGNVPVNVSFNIY